MNLEVVVLAAGLGKRMRSARPKVLHELAGRPMLAHVLDTASALGAGSVKVVHGHGGDTLREAFGQTDVQWVEQAEQKGTGHAVAQALPSLADDATVLVMYGDVPLVRADTLEQLVAAAGDGLLAALSRHLRLRGLSRPQVAARLERLLRLEEPEHIGAITELLRPRDATIPEGWSLELSDVRYEVAARSRAGEVLAVRARFATPLEDEARMFVVWSPQSRALVPFELPKVGASTAIEGERVTEIMQPE